MSSEAIRPIVIKRVTVQAAGHHGGAWKVAYADFVTAMMAFFLLMWLLNATTETQRKGLADYFDPSIPIGRISSGGRDLLAGDSLLTADTLSQSGMGGEAKTREKREIDAREPVEQIEATRLEQAKIEAIAGELRRTQDADGFARHVLVREVPEGLLIEVVDVEDEPMFLRGGDAPTERMRQILDIVANAVELVANEIVILGHTDATRFQANSSRDNLDLSLDRAQVARSLIATRLTNPGRIVRVEGRGPHELLDTQRPEAAINRRIGVLILS